ncbi:MAG TPA: Sec-independent protein translocase protein TatB [Methylotenera sp.]|nr:Sec-independent protein translocase protein TatB [Methylotenera sp.]
MFDVSFSELFVIAVVALLVIGPEKLPKVARTMGAFMGRMQRYVAQVKDEVNREVRFEELQKLQQEIKQSVENNLVKPVQQEAAVLKKSILGASDVAKTMTEVTKSEIKAKPAAKKRVTASNTKQKTTPPSIAKTNTKPKSTTSKIATKIK